MHLEANISKMAGDSDLVTIERLGNGYLVIEWSRDRCRHMTLKGQGRDTNMLTAQYLGNGWR